MFLDWGEKPYHSPKNWRITLERFGTSFMTIMQSWHGFEPYHYFRIITLVLGVLDEILLFRRRWHGSNKAVNLEQFSLL